MDVDRCGAVSNVSLTVTSETELWKLAHQMFDIDSNCVLCRVQEEGESGISLTNGWVRREKSTD